jgi:hypothetical protein
VKIPGSQLKASGLGENERQTQPSRDLTMISSLLFLPNRGESKPFLLGDIHLKSTNFFYRECLDTKKLLGIPRDR